MNTTTLKTHLPYLLPIIILSATLRLTAPGISQFQYDEARIADIVLTWLEGGALPLSSLTASIGIAHPPLPIYLFAIPYLITDNPAGAVAFVGLANTLAVIGTYWLANRWWGKTAAIVSALLFATSPWAILYARWHWGVSLLPPFIILSLITTHLALIEQKTHWQWFLPITLSLTAQLHPTGFIIIAWASLLLLIHRQNWHWKPLLGGSLIGLTLWTPYLIYLYQQWQTSGFSGFMAEATPPQYDLQVLPQLWRMTSGQDVHSILGADTFTRFQQTLPGYPLISLIAGLLATIALLWSLTQLKNSQTRPLARFILLLPLLYILATIRHTVPVYTHYLIVLYPALYLLTGWFTAHHTTHRRWLIPLVLLIALAQTGVMASLIHHLNTYNTHGGMALPLAHASDNATTIQQAPVCEIRLIGEGNNPRFHNIPAIYTALIRQDPRLVFVDTAQSPTLPGYSDGRTLVVVPPELASRYPDLTTLPSSLPPISLREGEGDLTLLYDDGGRATSTVGTLDPITFPNGVTLLNYATSGTPAPGRNIRLFLHWQLINQPNDDLYVFNRLLDSNNQLQGQTDDVICVMNRWQAHQSIWTWYDIPISPNAPPPPYTIQTGLASSTTGPLLPPLVIPLE